MAVQTAATSTRENVGSLTLHIFTFTSVTGADTFASGLPNVIGFWATAQANVGTTVVGAGVNVINSSGTFTFAGNVAASAITLYVIART